MPKFAFDAVNKRSLFTKTFFQKDLEIHLRDGLITLSLMPLFI